MPDEPGGLLLRIIVLVALLVGAVVATAEANAWWTVTLAVVALVIGTVAIGVSVGTMLRAQNAPPAGRGGRGFMALAAVAVVMVVAVVLATTLPVERSAATSTARPTAAAAAQTVRDFLASAVLDDNAYAACQYLTPNAQHDVARLAGEGQTCRDALSATQPSFAGIQTEGALHALRLHAVVRDGTAQVTTAPRGRQAVTFVLQPTTAAEASAFEAPPAAWRIADGATAVLGSQAR